MLKIAPTTRSALRLAFTLSLIALVVAACGLGMDNQDRLDRGQQALADGEHRAAIIDAKNILQKEPDNIQARLLLGRASVAIGDGVSAEKELRKAAELGAASQDTIVDLGRALLLQRKFEEVIDDVMPDLVTAGANRLLVLRIRGDALIGLRQPVAAREVYTEVLQADSNDTGAQLGIVNSYIAERNYIQARETLNQLLTFDDSYIPAWLTSGSLSMGMRNAERATSDYTTAKNLAVEQSNPAGEMQALAGLADALLGQRKTDAARPVLERMLVLAPEDTRTLLIVARLASVDQDWRKAQAALQEILRRAPDYRPAQMLLGAVHKESGNLGQAEMYLSAVVAAVPNNGNARRLLAETRLALGKAEAAREVLEPLVTGTGTDIGALSLAARASLSLGEFENAAALLKRGVVANPTNIDLQIQLAFAYLRAGESDKARAVLQAMPAVATERNEIQRDSLRIMTQMAQGSSDEALHDARLLLQRWPERSQTHSLAGAIEMSMGDYVAARKSFGKATELAPDNIGIIRYLAQLDELEDDPAAATDRYLLILELQPDETLAMVALARLATRSEQHDEALTWLEKARDADAAALTPRGILGSLYLARKEFGAAEKVVKEALGLDPDNAILHSLLGLAQISQDDFRGAEFSFGQAMKLQPDEPSYRLNMAKAQARRRNNASAQVTLEDALDQSLQHIPSGVMLALLKAQSGNFGEAKKIAAQLRELHPEDAAPLALEAELLARSGEPVAASAAYDKAMDIEMTPGFAIRAYQIRNQAELADRVGPLNRFLQERPLDSNMRVYLAQAYQRMEDLGKANTEYERVLADEPESFVAANNLAWNYFIADDPRAEEVARRAFAIQPDNGSVVDTLGWILVSKGALEDGIVKLRNAAELGNDNPEIRYHLAAGLAAAGEAEEAKSILQELILAKESFASRQEAEELLSTL